MSSYRILRRVDYDWRSQFLPVPVQRKAEWAMVQLGARGRTPSLKGTIGLNAAWRRSPVQGSHYYLWWIPASDTSLALNGHASPQDAPAILVHSVRHHDETDEPITVGEAADYEAVDLGLLDPRFEEQEAVASAAQKAAVAFAVIEGMPGSGKSVALLYLARDLATRPGVRKVRYITYTERLKRAAREIFDALGPEIAQHITVHTVNDVVKQLLGSQVVSSPYSELEAFARDLEVTNPAQLGGWRDYPHTLYTELRAHVVGRTFPAGYRLPNHRREQLREHGAHFDVERYARQRELDARSADLAVSLAERLRGRYFADQVAASRSLEKVMSGDCPAWLAHTDAFIVDEVQDLTLLQIALFAEMAHLRLVKHPELPLAITIAGDESQIVQPTGFKWGVTKDLLRERLGNVNPIEYEFQHQRRSPALLTALVESSWNLYAALPKDLRPSARQGHYADRDSAEAEGGMVIVAAPPAGLSLKEWQPLFDELAARPGRALIDLTEKIHVALSLGEAQGHLNEVLFHAREIKGLERATVLIFGLQELYQQVRRLTTESKGERIPLLEARRLIDQMRVALSRSTNRIVLIENADAPVFDELDFDAATSGVRVDLPALVEILQGEEMTEIEMVEALLEEAEELADRGRLNDALARNRRADAIAVQTESASLGRRTSRQYAHLVLQQSEEQLEKGEIAAAQQIVASLAEMAHTFADASLSERYELLRNRLRAASSGEYDRLLQESADARARQTFDAAVADAEAALSLTHDDPTPVRRDRASAHIVNACCEWSAQLAAARNPDDSDRIAKLIVKAVVASAAETGWTIAAVELEERYTLVPQRRALTITQIGGILELAQRYLRNSEGYTMPPGADAHLLIWLNETFESLENKTELYYPWAAIAQRVHRVIHYAMLDERIWDLENRLEVAGRAGPGSEQFSAFLSAYNGDPAAASLLWERLGETDQAIDSARSAGQLERAHLLLRTAHRPIPEEIATAVKTLRLLQQLQQKHQGLTAAERRTLLEELARLHTEVSSGLPPDEG